MPSITRLVKRRAILRALQCTALISNGKQLKGGPQEGLLSIQLYFGSVCMAERNLSAPGSVFLAERSIRSGFQSIDPDHFRSISIPDPEDISPSCPFLNRVIKLTTAPVRIGQIRSIPQKYWLNHVISGARSSPERVFFALAAWAHRRPQLQPQGCSTRVSGVAGSPRTRHGNEVRPDPIQYRLGKIVFYLEMVCHAQSAQTNPVSDIESHHSPTSTSFMTSVAIPTDCVPAFFGSELLRKLTTV